MIRIVSCALCIPSWNRMSGRVNGLWNYGLPSEMNILGTA